MKMNKYLHLCFVNFDVGSVCLRFLFFFFFFEKIRLGIQNELKIIVERDEEMRSKYYHPMEHFSDKIDQLLNALNRVLYFAYFC